MKRIFLMLALVAWLGGVLVPAASAQENKHIPVFIDGLPVNFDVQPVIQSGRTLVPFRAIAEALNVQVTWENTTQTVNATDANNNVRLQMGSLTGYRNQTPIPLDVPPLNLDGRTLIPLRFFSEAFDCQVVWDNAAGTVIITSPPQQMAVVGFYVLGDAQTSSWTNLFGVPYPGTSTGNTGLVSELALGWYSLDEQGNLLTQSRTGWQRPDGWEDILDAARSYNLGTEMVIHVTDEDGTITNLLTNETAMHKATTDILTEVNSYGGVNLNLEGLGYRDTGEQLQAVQNSFTDFVSLLFEQLQAAGKPLTLTLHAPNSVYRGYDYQALGQVSDKIIIMAYDYGAKPEPVNQVIQAVETAIAVIPAEKLVLGISAPNETPQSILTKVGIAKRYNLDGIALWRLGVISDEMWQVLKTTVKERS
ncbi:putative sporulation-specific glycosylase YdhD [Sporotomaculum syntrophicum]|uniref:Sporulation-specific glycosylase YdhD n=1 Tax=Sporotomaculum syntrophicum TaxID=182264 RepID=A0A9D2WMF6_9FIRM|nr:stalk domain-containing protein [Sporotomaculum syntrophicum]KAF1083888.1 putative sporulation-specific glycosylase YdhD [Sporotomaculum syntrophicum]